VHGQGELTVPVVCQTFSPSNLPAVQILDSRHIMLWISEVSRLLKRYLNRIQTIQDGTLKGGTVVQRFRRDIHVLTIVDSKSRKVQLQVVNFFVI
jgi:hypothetical protein